MEENDEMEVMIVRNLRGCARREEAHQHSQLSTPSTTPGPPDLGSLGSPGYVYKCLFYDVHR